MSHMVRWEGFLLMRFKQADQKHLCDLRPLYESLLRIVGALEDQSRTAPLNKLIELYNVTFSPVLREVIGTDLNDDLLALASLRNLFAHGRDFFLEFKWQVDGAGYACLDSNPIKQPALRLQKAGIIRDLNVTQETRLRLPSKILFGPRTPPLLLRRGKKD